MLLLLPHTWSLGTVTWNLSRTCSPLIQIASRSPKLFWASPCFRICPNAAGSWTSETWSFPRALITPCSCLIAILSLLLHPPPWLCCVNPCCASLLLVGRHRGTEAKPYGRGGCTGSFWGNQHCLCCCSLPPLLCLGWDLIFNYSVLSHFSVRLLPSITTPQGWRWRIERSCCSNWKVHRKQRDCWKNILQVQLECCTGELNPVLYFAR